MADDDPLSKFMNRPRGKGPTASAFPPEHREPPPEAEDEDYEALSNKVRPVCVELICNRSGLSYSIPYAHLGAIVFNFRTGEEVSFTGAGLGVTIRGRNLGGIARALRLHSCSAIEDSPGAHPRPDPRDGRMFVESIRVEVLGAKKREEE